MTKGKVAFVTGVTGQDGAYLAHLLLAKGYEVHGVKRRASSFNTQRIDPFYQDPHEGGGKLFLHYGDLTDSTNLLRLIAQIRPTEIYNLAAQSHVKVSFESPEYTANADGIGALRILEALRALGMEKTTRYYQASTSELFGQVRATPQNESTPFHPRSPYGVAKLYAYWITVNYREAYGMFAANGILFNHESPLRGETFVTRKITRAAARIACGLERELYVGNLDATRDWGHAREYVEGMWRILNAEKADDFVLATGRATTVRDFLVSAFRHAGIHLAFEGKGANEVARCTRTGKTIVRLDPKYLRPTEVESLLGDAAKAKRELGWEAKISVDELCREMVEADLHRAREELEAERNAHKTVEVLAHEPGGFLGWLERQGQTLLDESA